MSDLPRDPWHGRESAALLRPPPEPRRQLPATLVGDRPAAALLCLSDEDYQRRVFVLAEAHAVAVARTAGRRATVARRAFPGP